MILTAIRNYLRPPKERIAIEEVPSSPIDAPPPQWLLLCDGWLMLLRRSLLHHDQSGISKVAKVQTTETCKVQRMLPTPQRPNEGTGRAREGAAQRHQTKINNAAISMVFFLIGADFTLRYALNLGVAGIGLKCLI